MVGRSMGGGTVTGNGPVELWEECLTTMGALCGHDYDYKK